MCSARTNNGRSSGEWSRSPMRFGGIEADGWRNGSVLQGNGFWSVLLECLFRGGYHKWEPAWLAPPQEGGTSAVCDPVFDAGHLCGDAGGDTRVSHLVTAEASNSQPVKMHNRMIQRSPGLSNPRSAGQASPIIRPLGRSGQVCPGLGRGYECGTWPPPMDEDPDRKASSY